MQEACSPVSHSVGYNVRNGKIDDLKDNAGTPKQSMTLKMMWGKNKQSFLLVLIRRGCSFYRIGAFY